MSVLPDVFVLQLDDGRRLTVPHVAVISARQVADQAPAVQAHPRQTPPSAGRSGQDRPGAATPPAARTVTASTKANAEPFYFTYINEKGSVVSATLLLD